MNKVDSLKDLEDYLKEKITRKIVGAVDVSSSFSSYSFDEEDETSIFHIS